jgi:hypothetical protein
MIDAPPSATMEVSVVLGLLTFLFIYTHYRKQLAHTIANVTRYIMAQNISLNALFLNLVILIAHTINLFFYITLFLPIKGIETLYDNVSSASQRFKRLHMDPRLLILRLVRAPTKAFTMILDYTEYSLLFLPLMIMDWVVVTYCESDLHWSRNGYTGVTKTLLIPIWMIVLFVNVFFYCFWFMPALVLERVWGFFFEGVYEYDEAVAPNLGPVVTSPVTPRAVTFEERKNAVWDTDRTIMPTKSHRKPSLAKTEAISELDLNETNGEQCALKEVTEELRARIKSWRDNALGLMIDTSAVDDESTRRSFDSAIMLESIAENHIAGKTDKHDDNDSAVEVNTPVERKHDLAAGLLDAADSKDRLDILEADEESEDGGDRVEDMKANEHYFEFGFEDGPDVVERMMPGRRVEKVANADVKKNVG